MAEQQLNVALRERDAVKALLSLNEGERRGWCEANNFRMYQSYSTDDELKAKESQLSTEIHDLRAQGKFYLSIIYYFLILIYSSSFFHILFL